MSTGTFVLIGVFVLAAGCMLWNWLRQRSIDTRLAALGFEPCEAEAPALLGAWRELAAAGGGAREGELRVGACLRRPAGWGMLHRFQVNEGKPGPDHGEPRVGANYAAYLIDLRDPETLCRRPVTLFVLPPGSSVLRGLVRKVIEIDPPGRPLEIGEHPFARSILAAFGASEGKLDDCVPLAVQEKLARAAEHGFFQLHLGSGKAGFAVLPGHKDVDAELRYLGEWV